jgi:phospholipid transport system substrate-binding protein
MMRRRMVFGSAATALLATTPGLFQRAIAALDADHAAAFVKGVGDRLIAVINGPGGGPQKRAALTPIIGAAVDVDGIAQFCLGRFWRNASADERREYVDTFHAMLVNNIAGAVGEYQGVRFIVGQAQHREDAVVVATTIERPNNKPSPVDWLITEVGGAPKIEDMITEGVSLRLTERNDYEAFLAGNGNSVRTLIDSMRKKTAAHA